MNDDPWGCAAGRKVARADRHRNLDWSQPCPKLGDNEVPFDPPVLLCKSHYRAVMDDLYISYHLSGRID